MNLSDNLEEARVILKGLKRSERAHAYVQANSWTWPDVLIKFKPESFNQLSFDTMHKHVEFIKLYELLLSVTTEFQRSRQWWKERGIKSQCHKEWFKSYGNIT